MFLEERRRKIVERLRQDGRVAVRDLSDSLGVSAVTIRQDLRSLEAEGLLERTYGGAVLPGATVSGSELSFELRQRQHQAEKAAIAAAAAALVHDGDSIYLDGSTTAHAIVPHLKASTRLIVVTNSLMIAQGFLDAPQVEVLMPGGRLRRDSISLIDRPETLPDINLTTGFFGTRGISTTRGMTDTDPGEVAIKQEMITHCLRSVIVAHREKWERIAPYSYANPTAISTIITTADAPPHPVAWFREHGVEVITVEGPAPDGRR